MHSQEFRRIFQALTGNPPFPWQEALFARFVSDTIPTSVRIPTGLGKTSIVAIWLIALAQHPDRVPRRLVYVVNRRTVVDQTTAEVEKWRARLRSADLPKLRDLRARLAALRAIPSPASAADNDSPLAISTLRGQFADNREWSADPARPAVIVGTVDMIGSRLLFSGYTIGFKTRPHHAALLAQDTLLVHDEAHLEPAFQKLLESIVAAQDATGDLRMLRVMALTATSRGSNESASSFGLTDDDKRSGQDGVETNVVRIRFNATKRLRLHSVAKDVEARAEIIHLALEKKDSGRTVLVFVRSVDTAEKIANELANKLGREGAAAVATLTGTMRGKERDELVSGNPSSTPSAPTRVFQRFLPEKDRARAVEPATGTVFLVATSAGEVGVNLSADDLVCDLSTYESMAQRFGRVNRFGKNDDSTIAVVYAQDMQEKYDEGLAKAENAPKDAAKKVKAYETKNKITLARLKTLKLLDHLAKLRNGVGDASPAALDTLPAADRAAAFSPLPEMRIATAVQFDAWALTSIRERLAARPPVAPYLHGEADWEPPETHVAWRDEVQSLTGGTLLENYPPEELLEDFPLKPRELLRDTTERVFDRLLKIAETLQKRGQAIPDAWLVLEEGKVEVLPLKNLLTDEAPEEGDTDESGADSEEEDSDNTSGAKAAKDTAKRRKARFVARLADRTLILPPSFGGLSAQGFPSDDTDAASAATTFDVSTVSTVAGRKPDRLRLRSYTPKIPAEYVADYRLIRVIDTQLGSEIPSDDEGDIGENATGTDNSTTNRVRYWLWLEAKTTVGIERRFSANTAQPETLAAHTHAVEGHARALAEKLLPAPADGGLDLRRCLVLAATVHDLGKNRAQWQRNLGSRDNLGIPDYDPDKPETILAKSSNGMRPRNVAEHYRHEFGSLNDVARNTESVSALSAVSELERDIVFHLVAAHHGRARPHFPADEILDYHPAASPKKSTTLATEIPRRFARLQHHFGRWGLAWLESLLRAADYAASAGIKPLKGCDSSPLSPGQFTGGIQAAGAATFSADISLHLNPANPGHYFACCGLFELAAALASSAHAWFAEDGSTFHMAATGLSLTELLSKITAAEISAAGEEVDTDIKDAVGEAEDDEGSEEESSAPPLNIGRPFGIRLDWWNTASVNTSALKVWAGSMDVLSIARAMSYTIAQSLKTYHSIENILFESCVAYDPSKIENNQKQFEANYDKSLRKAEEKRTEALNKATATKSGDKLEREKSKIAKKFGEDLLKARLRRDSTDQLKNAKKEPFYFDANRGPNAHSRDIGFATNDLKWETLAAPAVELLTLVGLQRATPAPVPDTPRNFEYRLWTSPLPISLLPLAVNGLLPDNSDDIFRFESWFRTGQRKHKAFLTARIVSSR